MINDIEAIRIHFLDSLATIGIDESQIVMDNRPTKDLDESKIWVRFQVRPGATKEEQIGGMRILVTQLGQTILQVFAPTGKGSTDAFRIAEHFHDIFRKWRVADDSGHLRTTPYMFQAIPAQADDKRQSFFQVNSTVFYESLHRKAR